MKLSLLAAGVALAALPAVAHAETACAELVRIRLPHAEVTTAKLETTKAGLACRLSVTSRPVPDSSIGIEVWIPVGQAWNGKYVQVGSLSLGGAVQVDAIRARVESGYASAGTDGGHKGGGRTAAWALGHPEKVIDYASRSLKETTDAAKLLIAAMKGEPAKHSYFIGCATGGREALMEAQRFPTDFDGIVAGDPPNNSTLYMGGRGYMQQVLARPGGYLGLAQLKLLQSAALKQCADGGPFIRDQLACHFDPGVLRCKAGEVSDQCLTAPQLASARAIYGGRPDGKGGSIFPGYLPGGEAQTGGWQAWNTATSRELLPQVAAFAITQQSLKYFLYDDPAYDLLKADFGPRYDRDRRKLAPILDAVNPDLKAFKAHGGKLIQYHGWNDPAAPSMGSIQYFDQVGRVTGGADAFYRLYMIPGMLHCMGGAGPSQVDWLDVLDRWVETKAAPAALTATTTATGGESQLLCPYPGVARKVGDAWACRGKVTP